jgi:peptide subunit release factor 1 (eRF1)
MEEEIRKELKEFAGGQCLTYHIKASDTQQRIHDGLHAHHDDAKRSGMVKCQQAISFAAELILKYETIPPNGLVLFSGSKEYRNGYKTISVGIEIPPEEPPITRSLYIMDQKFHCERLGMD